MKKEKPHKGSSFEDHLSEGLRQDDELVFLHIKEALEDPDITELDDYRYLIQAIEDVAEARGKAKLAEQAGITRQTLHKILKGDTSPSFQNVSAILSAIGLKFSVEQIKRTIDTNQEPCSVIDTAQYAMELLPADSTFMKLQKIVYYAQAECLVSYGHPLFKEKIEAWAAGPVVRELFDKHRGFKVIQGHSVGNSQNLSLQQKICVNRAVQKYGRMDGDTLSHLTHIEDPWKLTRGKLPEHAKCNHEISLKRIQDYYSKLPDYDELDEVG